MRKLLAGSVFALIMLPTPPTAFRVFQERKVRINSGIDSGLTMPHPALNPVNSTIGSFCRKFAPQPDAIKALFGPRFACIAS
jgi:hypothetical protein